MVHGNLQFSAHLKCLSQLLILLSGVKKEVLLHFPILIHTTALLLDKVIDALLQTLDLLDGALHGDIEGVNGTLQPLEKVDLHHPDQEVLPIRLGEVHHLLLFVDMLILRQHIL